MKTREEIITSMCYTMRHDYGLDKHPDDAAFVTGLTGSQRKALWNQMSQLFDNDIAPYMDFKNNPVNGL
jgi:hypothetical protein